MQMLVLSRTFILVMVSALLWPVPSHGQSGTATTSLLIRTGKPYAATVSAVRAIGGNVRYQYDSIDAIAVDVPISQVGRLGQLLVDAVIEKDDVIAAPQVSTVQQRLRVSTRGSGRSSARAVPQSTVSTQQLRTLSARSPEFLNLAGSKFPLLFSQGITGQGVVVAVIDSGLRPGFDHLESDGSVVGGFDLVGDGLGFSNDLNDGHGTFVAGIISANVAFDVPPASLFFQSVAEHAPGAVLQPGVVGMFGSAPLASIYSVRVYGPPANGIPSSAPKSRILAAIDHVITLRQRFDLGLSGGINIRVCNISLGGSTQYAGRDFLDRSLERMLAADILPVVSIGNTGPSGLTASSPGTSLAALTVGAASLPQNDRVLRSLEFGGVSFGTLVRPDAGIQTAWFSSRGPNADGRQDPEVVANGVASFGQGIGPQGTLLLADGTSFAAPVVAGLAALLREALPSAPAHHIRAAIIGGANGRIMRGGSTVLDHGVGLVDAAASLRLLASGLDTPLNPERPVPLSTVRANLVRFRGLHPRTGNVSENTGTLSPAERFEILYEVPPNAQSIRVDVSGFQAAPPHLQNQLFGDDLVLFVHSAKTSSIGAFGDYYPVGGFTRGGTWTIPNPEPGILRVTVLGDWTNVSAVSATVRVSVTRGTDAGTPVSGPIRNASVISLPVVVPAGVQLLDLTLDFGQNWGDYPTSDLDMLIVDPVGNINPDGISQRSPELVSINAPKAGLWQVIVFGFLIPQERDVFHLRIRMDSPAP